MEKDIGLKGGMNPFGAGVRYLCHFAKHGTVNALSAHLDLPPSNIRQMCDRPNMPTMARMKDVASFFGVTPVQIMLIGEEALAGKTPFPFLTELKDTQPHSLERAAMIFELVGKNIYGMEVEGFSFFTSQNIGGWGHPTIDGYVHGVKGDGDVYATALEFFNGFKKKDRKIL